MAVSKKTRTNSGISPYMGTWDRSAVIHLLRRVHFGVKLEDITYFEGLTLNSAISEILDVDYTTPSPPVNNYNDRNIDPAISAGETWVNNYNSQLNGARRASFKQWWTGQIINQDRTIREKMVLFWHNHFSTETAVISWANFVYQNNALLRSSCLKNFKQLTKDVTLDPGMLIYLNGEKNTKTAPDENYSRELQELFTLGKGPNSKYTEDDVITGARVLSGWRVNKQLGTVYFQANRHDTEDKTFSSFYNNTVITGKQNAAGETEVDDLLDMIFAKDEVAHHIVRKLYRWFVYHDIDESTEQNVITPLANIFINNNYEIKPVIDALLKSEHFFDVANRHALLKSPADFSMGLARSFDLQIPDSTEYIDQYRSWYYIYLNSALQQQDLGDPPNVAGWPAYYQLPQYHELWINSDTLPKRNKFTDSMIANGYNVNGTRLQIDPIHFVKKINNAANPNTLINTLLETMHTLEVEQAQKDYMKTILLSGQIDESYWTNAWNDYITDQNNSSKEAVIAARLRALIKYVMNLSEYQLS